MPAGELTSKHDEQSCGSNACKGRSPNDETLIDCSFRHCRCARAKEGGSIKPLPDGESGGEDSECDEPPGDKGA